jgi:S1-C subfamily serine protease
MRAWTDFGARTSPSAGGLLVTNVQPNGVAASLGLQDDDLLVEMSSAPTITLQDLNTTLLAEPAPRNATWIRGESLMRSTT